MSNKRDKRKHKNDDGDYDDWLEQLFTTPPKKSTFNRSNEQQQSNRITEYHSIESMMVENVQNEDDPAVNDDVTAVDSSFNEPIKNVLDVDETDDVTGLAIGLALLKKRRKLTWSSIQGMLSCLRGFNKSFPITSSYSLSKIVHTSAQSSLPLQYKKFFICTNCLNCYDQDKCQNCFISKKNFQMPRFIIADIGAQLLLLFSRNPFIESLRNPQTVDLESGDILLGLFLQRVYEQVQRENFDYVLTGQLHADGVQKFKNSSCSFVPIYLVINELPLSERFKPQNTILVAIWCSNINVNRQILQVIYKEIVNQLIPLEKGLSFHSKYHQRNLFIGFFVIATVCDKPMKNKSANMIQHNGYYSCTYCLSPGESFATENDGFSVMYPPPSDRSYRLRSETTYRWAMEQKKKNNKNGMNIKGHYGPIAFQSLRFHTFPSSFLIETMHSVYHGITSLLLNLWTKPVYKKEPWSFCKKLNQFNMQMRRIQLPTSTFKICRPIDNLIHHKANELRSFLLVYFVILKDFLSEVYFNHHLLLVQAIFKLSEKKNFSTDSIQQVHDLLERYVMDFSRLYGESLCRSVIEDLRHLATQYEYFGAIVETDAFGFESLNGQFREMFHGKKENDVELIKSFFFFLETHAAHTNHKYNNEMLYKFCDQEANNKRSWTSKVNGIKFAFSKNINQLKESDVKLFLKQQSNAEQMQYVRYCEFNGMQVSSGLLVKKENKYRDTVVIIGCDLDGYQNYYIDLLFYSEERWFFVGRKFIQSQMTSCAYPPSIVSQAGKFQDSLQIISLHRINERLAVYEDLKMSEHLFLIRVPSFCSHS